MGQKKCRLCKEVFIPVRSSQIYCGKQCSRKAWKITNYDYNLEINRKHNVIWSENNRQHKRDYDRQWRKDNPCKRVIQSQKRRAVKHNIKECYSAENIGRTLYYFDYCCFKCGAKDELCIDHHLPLSKGYALGYDNAAVLCRSCNSSKSAMWPWDYYTAEELRRARRLMGACWIVGVVFSVE